MTLFWSLALIPTNANLVITWSHNPQSRMRSDLLLLHMALFAGLFNLWLLLLSLVLCLSARVTSVSFD